MGIYPIAPGARSPPALESLRFPRPSKTALWPSDCLVLAVWLLFLVGFWGWFASFFGRSSDWLQMSWWGPTMINSAWRNARSGPPALRATACWMDQSRFPKIFPDIYPTPPKSSPGSAHSARRTTEVRRSASKTVLKSIFDGFLRVPFWGPFLDPLRNAFLPLLGRSKIAPGSPEANFLNFWSGNGSIFGSRGGPRNVFSRVLYKNP